MLVVAILFVVFFCQCLGFAKQVPDTATTQNDPLEDKLASLLRTQDDKLASLPREQESTTPSLLREQDDKWASLLREQDAKLADLTSLLQQQGQKLSDQEHLLHKEEQKLSFQERSHRQLEQKVSDQEDLLRHQDQKLSHQESLLQEQGALLEQRGRSIQQQKTRHAPPQSFPSENFRHATDMSQSETPLLGKTSDSASHDVIPRSEDEEPLQAVVSQITQRVTEMGADIQVFKTQTVNDINALKIQTSGDIQTLQNSSRQQDLAIQDAQSSTFVHWGSSTCSNLSHTVYSGVVGGSWYLRTGAAINYLCLTMSPVFSDLVVSINAAHLYGGEYKTYDSHQNKDPVCAVCRPSLSTTVMIPGTNVCTPGWHLQYSGFLMAGHHGNTAGSEFICVDSRLENNVHGDAIEDSKLLYYTVTQCGSLPCTPYVNNKVVTCAVCSK
ncbi:putative leucine-rich repeat-containing protein DDB_G0290503 [Littorina saxatilis]|uniref:Uncharacterized protein n=1 Tax=Littorina saxatilis TaxID=31220 RepID=A0AAN9G4J5_9CAEN